MKYLRGSLSHRLKIIAGQVEGLARMIEEEKYCIDILTQSLAVQKALKKIDSVLMEKHISNCVPRQAMHGDVKKLTEELLSVYKYK